MARIAGVDLPNNKRGEIGLTYIFGIGRSSARKILSGLGIDFDTKVGEWNDEQIAGIRNVIATEYKIEGELRSTIQMNIKRLMDIGCYRGQRTTPVQERVRRKQLQTRRRQPNNGR